MGCLLTWGLQEKKIFFNRIILLLIHCKQKFQHPLIASVSCQKGQEELPDISVVVTRPDRDLMLSTDPRLSLNQGDAAALAAHAPLRARCQVPTQRKRLLLFLGPFPVRERVGGGGGGICVLEGQTRTILLNDS